MSSTNHLHRKMCWLPVCMLYSQPICIGLHMLVPFLYAWLCLVFEGSYSIGCWVWMYMFISLHEISGVSCSGWLFNFRVIFKQSTAYCFVHCHHGVYLYKVTTHVHLCMPVGSYAVRFGRIMLNTLCMKE